MFIITSTSSSTPRPGVPLEGLSRDQLFRDSLWFGLGLV